jgi:phage-related protein
MSITVSQLATKIVIEGATQAESDLVAMDTNSRLAQAGMNMLQNASRDAISGQLSQQISNAQGGLMDLAARANAAGIDVSKLSTLQAKAAESAAKLGVAESQYASAQQKANELVQSGTASAEKIALAQSKAALASEKVNVAENAVYVSMQKVNTEANLLAEGMQKDTNESSLFSRALEGIGGMLTGVKEKMQGASTETGEFAAKSKEVSGGGLLDFASKAGMAFMGVQMAVQTVSGAITAVLGPAEAYQDILKQTNDVVKSTGGAAHMSAQSITDLATSLGHVTSFSRDTVQTGENLLLTFTNIGQNVFPQATKTMLDMSKSLGQDTKSSAIQLGKALNDPITGITALSRVGVTFDAQQKQLIKTYMAHGDIAKAQGIILKELNREFGNSSDATGTLAGKWQILKNQMNDAKENIGSAVMPILGKLADWSIAIIPDFQKVGAKAGEAFAYIGNVLKSVPLMELRDSWKAVTEELGYSIRKIGEVAGTVLGPTLKLIKTDADPVAEAIQKLAKGAVDILSGALWTVSEAFVRVDKQLQAGKGPLIDFANGMKPLTDACKNLFALQWDQFKTVLNDVGKDAKQLGDWFKSDVAPALKDAAPGFESLGMTLLNTVAPAFIQIRGVVIDVIQHAFEKFAPIIERIVPPLIRFAGIIAKDVSDAIKFLTPYVIQAVTAIGRFADEIIDRVAPIVKGWIDSLTPLINMFADNWNHTWPMMSAILKGAWDEIVGWVQIGWALVSGIIKIGLDIMSGNWSQAWTDLKDTLSGVWDGIKTVVKGGIEIIGGFFSGIWNNMTPDMKKPFQDAWNFIEDIFNKIQGVINSITGQKITPDTSQIMTGVHHFASGVQNFAGGWAVVGEQGPELLKLPSGSSVVPNGALGLSSGGSSGSTVIHNHMHVYLDGKDITNNVQTRSVKSARTSGPLRGKL